MSSGCPHTADLVQATNFGAIRAFAAYGQPAVKRRVMPELVRGERIITVAMTEPGAGSAVTDLRTAARIEGDQVVLNGQKIFNSTGPSSTPRSASSSAGSCASSRASSGSSPRCA